MNHSEQDIAPFVEKKSWGYGIWGGRQNAWEDWLEEEKPAKESSVKSKTNTFIITEIHQPSPAAIPMFFGETPDGELVRITIPHLHTEEIKKKIVGRGLLSGYYTSEKLFYSLPHKTNPGLPKYFVTWENMQWVQAKPQFEVKKKKGGGFTLIEKEPKGLPADTAPWYEPQYKLTRARYHYVTQCGCDLCNNIPKWEDKDHLLWVGEKIFFCKDCQDTTVVKEYVEELKHSA